ncbi:Transcriptional regulator, contains XRE-family HTH domain [Lentzea xinjiangensis]|uniref:Transcriptional regulator, contains XRE-family HTH domain n=1 Tax=Lentzea xinjiangensis TaxID=402600 RepID=A0A1H9L8D4_9PSEU|nr:helix-turn-helix transcriptional regulator [Lentzea xinjiangensis]SER07732.1 Transcriptional regulator, contains XRE-family HTH domain [Lentzea xinjiangensis]
MKITERTPKDERLSWTRKGGIVLVAFLERVAVEHNVARLTELVHLSDVDLLNQLRRFTKACVVGRRTDVDVVPAEDHFWLSAERVDRARALLQQADDADLRELVAERGLDIDRALGDFSTQQPYPVALGKALRDARIASGPSQAEVAEKVPTLSNVELSQFENGHALPTLITLAELAHVYKVDAADLIVQAVCHSKPDKQVLALRVAEPTFRAVLTHKFAERRVRELNRTKSATARRSGAS